mgnify:CR=1 FL=1
MESIEEKLDQLNETMSKILAHLERFSSFILEVAPEEVSDEIKELQEELAAL